MRLIDADEAEKALAEEMAYEARIEYGGRQKAKDYLLIARAYFQNCPTVEAEPVRRGRWETVCSNGLNGRKYVYNVCSLCGVQPCEPYKYCPSCGALMEGE